MYRRQKGKGLAMGIFFTIFLIIFGYYVVRGLLLLYNNMFAEAGIPAQDMELAIAYFKHSIIPGLACAIIYLHSGIDAYRG